MTYTLGHNRDKAERLGTSCVSCSQRGSKNPQWGKKWTDNQRQIMTGRPAWNKGLKGAYSDEYIQKLRDAKLGRTWEDRMGPEKASIALAKKSSSMKTTILEKAMAGDDWHAPNFNKNAIPILEQKAEALGITDLQHALNGGEVRVLHYFVDGYSKERNTVIEYYEAFHNKPSNIKRDKQRQQEITDHLGCEFVIIKE